MERLTMLVNSHLLDNGKLDKEYDLNNKIQLNEYSCMDIPNAVYNKLGELEDVLEKYNIENPTMLDFYLQTIKNINMQNANMRNELAELKAKMIVPKFKVGQEIYVIDDYFKVTSAIIERVIINTEYSISEGETSYVHYLANLGEKYEWDERYLILYGEDISLTKEEAEKKLAEIKGEKDE